MKRTVTRITIFVCLFAAIHSDAKKNFNQQQKTFSMRRGIEKVSPWVHHYTPLFGLNHAADLSCYHIGLLHLLSKNSLPSTEEMKRSIYSHPLFCGQVSVETGEARFKNNPYPYLLFEEDKQPARFYVAHQKGLRPFTIEEKSYPMQTVGFCKNCVLGGYPTLLHFLKCTISYL